MGRAGNWGPSEAGLGPELDTDPRQQEGGRGAGGARGRALPRFLFLSLGENKVSR